MRIQYLLLAVLFSWGAWAQTRPSFEVASVKASPPPSGNMIRMGTRGGPGTADPGRVTVDNLDLKSLIQQAYGLKVYQLVAPDWMGNARFDIVATVPAGATKEQVLLMWQQLLEDRFKLAVHRETKELPLYALVVAKGGPKLTEADPAPPASSGGASPATGNAVQFSMSTSGAGGGGAAPVAVMGGSIGSIGGSGGGRSRTSGQMTMGGLVNMVTRSVDRPVIDETGLTGRYKINLEWQREDLSATADSAGTGPTLFAALQEQLGLRLDPRKGPVELLVVDHAEKSPTEN